MASSIDVPSPYHDRLTPRKTVANYVPDHTFVEKHPECAYEDLNPFYPDIKWPALEEVPYEDKGLLGDPYFHNLKEIAIDIGDYISNIGTEVHGVDLTDLTNDQKNDIARLIGIRGVVFFRNQKNFDVEEQRKLGAYFGTLHKHATTSSPKCGGLDDVLVVWTDEKLKRSAFHLCANFSVTYECLSSIWLPLISHSRSHRISGLCTDETQVTCEIQPRLILALNSLLPHPKVAVETLPGPPSTLLMMLSQSPCKRISAHLRLCTPRKCNMMTPLQRAGQSVIPSPLHIHSFALTLSLVGRLCSLIQASLQILSVSRRWKVMPSSAI